MSASIFMVTGSGSGLGALVARKLREHGHAVHNFDRGYGHDVRDPEATFGAPPPVLHGLIQCAAVNRTQWLDAMTDELWDEVIDTNARGLWKMAQWALPSLVQGGGTILNIVSDAAHKPMTTSIAYNASKGAAHIMTLQMAHELWPRHRVLVWGIAPNKLHGTGMSRDIERQVQQLRGWTAEYAAEYQRKSLSRGVETDPEDLAEFIVWAMSQKSRHKWWHKTIVPYGA